MQDIARFQSLPFYSIIYVLTNVRSTGRSFGSFRSAVEMEMGGTAMTCVGKEIRDTSLAVFLEECGTLFDLRHPHIVQYLGVSVPGSGSALVVMEYLPHSLDHVLKSTARLSQSCVTLLGEWSIFTANHLPSSTAN